MCDLKGPFRFMSTTETPGAGTHVSSFGERPEGNKASKKRKMQDVSLLDEDEKEIMKESLELKKELEDARVANEIANVRALIELYGRDDDLVKEALAELKLKLRSRMKGKGVE